MADFPVAVPPGTPQVDRAYLEVPQDETPPSSPDDPPVKFVEPKLLHIMVKVDQKPLMTAVDKAIKENDIQRVISLFNNGKFVAERAGEMLVNVVMKP
jgi:hypothetical protein